MLTLVCSAVSQFDMRIASSVFAWPALLLILNAEEAERGLREEG